MRPYQKTTATRAMDARATWMRQYEARLVGKRPEMQGKIDWDTATYLFLAGRNAIEAADTVATRRAEIMSRPGTKQAKARTQAWLTKLCYDDLEDVERELRERSETMERQQQVIAELTSVCKFADSTFAVLGMSKDNATRLQLNTAITNAQEAR